MCTQGVECFIVDVVVFSKDEEGHRQRAPLRGATRASLSSSSGYVVHHIVIHHRIVEREHRIDTHLY